MNHNFIMKLISSRYFLPTIIVIFLSQLIFLSVKIPYGIPSDEAHHYTLTKYYAERSVFSGPVIADQNDNFDLGDIQRTPGYLYHYLMSFPLKIVMLFSDNMRIHVLYMRFINIGLAILSVWLFIVFLRRLGARGVVVNLTVAWLTITTMFVWLFAAMNYDNLAIVLFAVLLNLSLSIYKHTSVISFIASLPVSAFLVLTKETYLPIIFLTYLLLFIGLLIQTKPKKLMQKFKTNLKSQISSKQGRIVLVGVVALAIIAGGMFGERYVQNYVKYGKTTPGCTQIHSIEECMEHSIYRRNTGQRQEYLDHLGAGGERSMSTAVFAYRWVGHIYERTYSFRGMRSIRPSPIAAKVSAISAIVIFSLAFMGIRRAKLSVIEKGLFLLSAGYVLLVFFYNLNTYLYYGYPFAIQGRYLLPVLPLIYYLLIRCMFGLGGVTIAYKRLMLGVMTMLLLINIAVQTPLAIIIDRGDILTSNVTEDL